MKPHNEEQLEVGEDVVVFSPHHSQYNAPPKDVVVAVNSKFITLQSGRKFSLEWEEWGFPKRISKAKIGRWSQAKHEECVARIEQHRQWMQDMAVLEGFNWRHCHDLDWLHMMAECVKTKLAEIEREHGA